MDRPGSATAPDPVERPRRDQAVENRARILEVARQAFNEDGPDVSMSDIARRAGVGIGTIYRNFASKDELLRLLAEQVATSLSERAEAALEAADPAAGVELLVRAFVEINRDYRTLIVAARASQPQAALPPTPASYDRMRHVTNAVLDRGIAAGVVRADTDLIDIAVLSGAIGLMGGGRSAVGAPDDDLEARTERLVAMVVAGLRPNG